MRNLFFLISFFIYSFSYEKDIQASYAIGIFDEKGNGENIQHKRFTNSDYNGTCFSKIVVFGNLNSIEPQVKIGDSLGYFENSTSIYNKDKIKIGEEMTFKHYNISKGYFEIKIADKIYDMKVYVK